MLLFLDKVQIKAKQVGIKGLFC